MRTRKRVRQCNKIIKTLNFDELSISYGIVFTEDTVSDAIDQYFSSNTLTNKKVGLFFESITYLCFQESPEVNHLVMISCIDPLIDLLKSWAKSDQLVNRHRWNVTLGLVALTKHSKINPNGWYTKVGPIEVMASNKSHAIELAARIFEKKFDYLSADCKFFEIEAKQKLGD